MEQSRARTQIISQIRERTATVISHRLDDRNLLQLAIVAAMREPDDTLGMLFPPLVIKSATPSAKIISITADEWADLFGVAAAPLRDGGLAAVVGSAEFAPSLAALTSTMRCTINEAQQKTLWERQWTRALCFVAVHLLDPEARLTSVMGTLVKADERRIEEMTNEIDDDDGGDAMLMAKVVIALAESLF